ncbi:MAG: ABC transporter substrate-binding protein, partial [Pseudomonadales bacterium]|nr:ABC transporter substrate-binding protein [Pseudomonadales bacterium]
TGPQFDNGQLIKTELPNHNPTGMQAFAYNTRRPYFKDPKVRQALAYAFDFEWTNQNIFYSAYTRTHSYFSNSELASTGLPSPEERAILEPYKAQVPPEVFTTPYQPPTTKGDGNIRSNIRQALSLLKEAGWQIKNNQLTHVKSGQIMAFEILLVSPTFERVVLPFKKNLARLGVKVNVSVIDPQQYINRLNNFDFDMIVSVFGQSNSPGNEQRDFWHSSEADRPGSRNLMGIKDPVVDALIEQVIGAPDREALVNRTRALDRVLLWGHYVIPQFHNRSYRIAYWDKFERPQVMAKFSLGIDTWWTKK